MKKPAAALISLLLILLWAAGSAQAHGVIGKRFIPSTLAVDDPFPSDEVDLFTFNRAPEDKEGRQTSFGFEFGKRLTPDFAIGIGWEYLLLDPRDSDQRKTSGAGNPEFSLKYSLFKSPEHETMVSAGLGIEAGGVGPNRAAERVTTISPTLLFAKGLGDLPDSLPYLKPFSLTGSLAVNNPANRTTGSGDDKEHNPTTLNYGLAVIYSIPYLQSFIKDVGLGAPFDRMFPLMEFNFSTTVSKPDKGQTTAFANPGLLWAGRYVQLGLEAQVPMNNASGKNAGVRALVHVFIDDIWPNIFTWTPWGVIGPTLR